MKARDSDTKATEPVLMECCECGMEKAARLPPELTSDAHLWSAMFCDRCKTVRTHGLLFISPEASPTQQPEP